MSDLVKRLRSIRGSFIIPIESPNIFAWAEEAADALEQAGRDAEVWKTVAGFSASDVIALKDALDRLLYLKAHKDEHGKTDYYIDKQPLAWRQAREALSREGVQTAGVSSETNTRVPAEAKSPPAAGDTPDQGAHTDQALGAQTVEDSCDAT